MLELEVTSAPHESTLHALVRMLEHAQAQRVASMLSIVGWRGAVKNAGA